MTKEYAILSLRAGILAAAIFEVTKSEEVIQKLRKLAWDLTPETLEQIKLEAVMSGVSQAVLDDAEAEAARFAADESFMRGAMDIQTSVDALRAQVRQINKGKVN